MTVKDRVEELLTNIWPKAICDRCIAKKLKLSVSQHANQKTRELECSPSYVRKDGICDFCHGHYRIIQLKRKQSVNSTYNNRQKSSHSFIQDTITQTPNKFKELKKIGFSKAGLWVMKQGSLCLELDKYGDHSPALYAFISVNRILYIGKTRQALKRRLYFYGKPGPSQRTNRRVNNLLVEQLKTIPSIDIYAFCPSIIKKIGIFKLNIPASLEDDIITKTRPLWNIN